MVVGVSRSKTKIRSFLSSILTCLYCAVQPPPFAVPPGYRGEGRGGPHSHFYSFSGVREREREGPGFVHLWEGRGKEKHLLPPKAWKSERAGVETTACTKAADETDPPTHPCVPADLQADSSLLPPALPPLSTLPPKPSPKSASFQSHLFRDFLHTPWRRES